ncbi:hypothetical protein HK097_009642 [Rhizophlyctis rosea]|uniref:Uncharacterized protein n=1 Tax=Rhizophlyctis rosea TaxID=64517 RepID=A0AAD5X3N3_9FUNG|nr:hypothetical protein HK097_009642 [Rhizophlyctis rosea]
MSIDLPREITQYIGTNFGNALLGGSLQLLDGQLLVGSLSALLDRMVERVQTLFRDAIYLEISAVADWHQKYYDEPFRWNGVARGSATDAVNWLEQAALVSGRFVCQRFSPTAYFIRPADLAGWREQHDLPAEPKANQFARALDLLVLAECTVSIDDLELMYKTAFDTATGKYAEYISFAKALKAFRPSFMSLKGEEVELSLAAGITTPPATPRVKIEEVPDTPPTARSDDHQREERKMHNTAEAAEVLDYDRETQDDLRPKRGALRSDSIDLAVVADRVASIFGASVFVQVRPLVKMYRQIFQDYLPVHHDETFLECFRRICDNSNGLLQVFAARPTPEYWVCNVANKGEARGKGNEWSDAMKVHRLALPNTEIPIPVIRRMVRFVYGRDSEFGNHNTYHHEDVDKFRAKLWKEHEGCCGFPNGSVMVVKTTGPTGVKDSRKGGDWRDDRRERRGRTRSRSRSPRRRSHRNESRERSASPGRRSDRINHAHEQDLRVTLKNRERERDSEELAKVAQKLEQLFRPGVIYLPLEIIRPKFRKFFGHDLGTYWNKGTYPSMNDFLAACIGAERTTVLTLDGFTDRVAGKIWYLGRVDEMSKVKKEHPDLHLLVAPGKQVFLGHLYGMFHRVFGTYSKNRSGQVIPQPDRRDLDEFMNWLDEFHAKCCDVSDVEVKVRAKRGYSPPPSPRDGKVKIAERENSGSRGENSSSVVYHTSSTSEKKRGGEGREEEKSVKKVKQEERSEEIVSGPSVAAILDFSMDGEMDIARMLALAHASANLKTFLESKRKAFVRIEKDHLPKEYEQALGEPLPWREGESQGSLEDFVKAMSEQPDSGLDVFDFTDGQGNVSAWVSPRSVVEKLREKDAKDRLHGLVVEKELLDPAILCGMWGKVVLEGAPTAQGFVRMLVSEHRECCLIKIVGGRSLFGVGAKV